MNVFRKITTLTSREFNQDVGKAKRAARHGPVVVTDRGKPAHVMLSYDEYQRLDGERLDGAFKGKSLLELLADPEGADSVDLDLPERRVDERPINLD